METQPQQMSRAAGPVDLSSLTGATVTRVYVDQHAAGILLDLGPVGGVYDWRVEQAFRLRSRDRVDEPDPENPSTLVPLVSVLGATLEKADASLDGSIRFDLSGGIAIECGTDPQYEAWQLAGPGGVLLVCLPGGGLAVWPRE